MVAGWVAVAGRIGGGLWAVGWRGGSVARVGGERRWPGRLVGGWVAGRRGGAGRGFNGGHLREARTLVDCPEGTAGDGERRG